MKRRVNIFLVSLITIIILLPSSFIFKEPKDRTFFAGIVLTVLVYVLIYSFGGLAKLIIYSIYGIICAMLLIVLPQYQIAITLLASLLFVLNPLAEFENYLSKRISDEEIVPINVDLYGSRAPYMAYRKEMKNYYHLPQTRKLYTKKPYYKLRQVIILILTAIGVFVLINQLGEMAITFENFKLSSFFSSLYGLFVIVTSILVLYKKGFTSLFRILVILIYPPIIYVFLIYIPVDSTKYILSGVALILGIATGVYEFIKLRARVIFEHYHYYDQDKQREVFANALFEPFVYNENYQISVVYQIAIALPQFQKKLQQVLIYANAKKFFITAYTYDKKFIKLYCEFHNEDELKVHKFLDFLEAQFNDQIQMVIREDKYKTLYEKNFFHQPNYIIARALYLADILDELEIRSKVIISFVVYFNTNEDLHAFSLKYNYKYLRKISYDGHMTVQVDLQVPNTSYIIETKIQEFLLDLLIYNGHYVRINLYY